MNILTSFPFTFKLTVPGLSNPFTSLTTTPSPTSSKNPPVSSREPNSERPTRSLVRPTRPLPISITGASPMAAGAFRPPRPVFSASPSPTPSGSLSFSHTYTHLSAPRPHFVHSTSPSPAPLNRNTRKRGWEPSPSPSPSEPTLTSTNGYLDTPAKYRDMAGGMEMMDARELGDGDLPPTKRRRGLAGSIVSTAWSAALIGTAVGLTVYKLWRNRGQNAEESTEYSGVDHDKMNAMMVETESGMSPEPPSPPPPYNQEWTAIDYPQQQSQPHLTPRRREKGKQRIALITPRSAARRPAARTRLAVSRKTATVGRSVASSAGPSTNLQPEFDFGIDSSAGGASTSSAVDHPPTSANGMAQDDPESGAGDVDDQMDWIGGKLAQLIEEGKKALNKEVVVMSDAKEDEEDDGSGAWVSDDEERRRGRGGSIKRRGSTRSRRSTVVGGGGGADYNASSASTLSASSSVQPSYLSVPTTPRRTQANDLGSTGLGSVANGDDQNYESPEVREMMERARAKLAAKMRR